ncbi:glycosyltransferase family 4 protein [Sphingomonas qilianensis]|uniref:Glycosyltransferase family 4 protein n=1 Tax=Sphingomonas qilianensis TaxID=1736690 RepID=A0ABU9XPE6_9SPHN
MSLAAPRTILIATPGRQHADHLAAALLEAGFAATLHYGTPIRPGLSNVLAAHSGRHTLLAFVFRTANRLLPLAMSARISARLYDLFDRRIARQLRHTGPRAVIGYESAALHLFTAARRRGVTTILDAASVHHRLQAEAGLADAGSVFRGQVNARKDAEIALADHILCCSTLAAQSYLAAGVPVERVHIVPLGFEPRAFAPDPTAASHTGPLRIAFVGRFTTVKGADLLATALQRLTADGIAYDCRVAALRADGDQQLVARLALRATLLGKVPHERLADLYRWADLLVMPSRFDSFGLVVPEALACGLPVLASDRVGAGDLITPGVNGDIVPFNDADALTAKLALFAADPELVRVMRPAAAASVRGAEWMHYRAHAAATVAAILEAAPRP